MLSRLPPDGSDAKSEYLADFRQLSQETTRGCIVLERLDRLQQLVERHSAKDSAARGTAMQELKAMIPRTSQYHPGHEIPEKNLYYRLAKKFLFNDFGVYQGHDHTTTAAPFVVGKTKPVATVEEVSADAGCCGASTECSSHGTVVQSCSSDCGA